MQVTELIQRLQKVSDKYGDIEVLIMIKDDSDVDSIREIHPWSFADLEKYNDYDAELDSHATLLL
jgi:hypothetical protein